jgi:Na+-translocating ferredoxin:NAD+ oxidoreductase RnfG subunit
MKITIFILVLFLTVSPLFSASLQEDAEKNIREHYGDSVVLTFSKITIDKQTKSFVEKSAGQKFRKPFVYFWTVEKAQFEYAFAIVDQIKAKSAVITVLALFNQDCEVDKVHILKYVGEHGRGVNDHSWLSQFIGKHRDSDFKIGSGIDSVSGATFSANTITRGVHRWSLLVDALKEKCELPVH